ncbi:FRG domain-containing protein [Fusobacterium varium]
MEYSDIVEEKAFKTSEELLKEISLTGKYEFLMNNYLFRGQSNSEYKLIPSSLRENSFKKIFPERTLEDYAVKEVHENLQKNKEYEILCSFYEEADKRGLQVPIEETIRNTILCRISGSRDIIDNPEEQEWISKNFEEISALAQHYGIPTRLLDWSRDVYTALYFAASDSLNSLENKEKKENKISLWAFNLKGIMDINAEIERTNLEIEEKNSNRIKYNSDDDNEKVTFLKFLLDLTEKLNKQVNTCPSEVVEVYDEIRKYNLEIEEYNSKIKEGKMTLRYKQYPIPIKVIIPPYYPNPNLQAQLGVLTYQKTKWQKGSEAQLMYKYTKYAKKSLKKIIEERLSLDSLIHNCIKSIEFSEEFLKNNKIFSKDEKANKIFFKFTLPIFEAPKLLEKLHKIGYDGASLFPGYYGIRNKIEEKLKIEIIGQSNLEKEDK